MLKLKTAIKLNLYITPNQLPNIQHWHTTVFEVMIYGSADTILCSIDKIQHNGQIRGMIGHIPETCSV